MEKKTLFIVDDDKLIQHFLEYSFIGNEKFIVRSFYDPDDFLANLGLCPDLIVLDHTFAGKNTNGLETLKKIRSIDQDVPVIILSRHNDETLMSQYLRIGATRFIVKDDYFLNILFEAIEQIEKEY